jgi:hypothetical protein
MGLLIIVSGCIGLKLSLAFTIKPIIPTWRILLNWVGWWPTAGRV